MLGHKPSTQSAVVVDTLEDSQVQDTQVDDDETVPAPNDEYHDPQQP